jgi:hypothetical protein
VVFRGPIIEVQRLIWFTVANMTIIELRRLLETPGLTVRERTALKFALAFLRADPPVLLSDEEYLELPRKMELLDFELCLTY